MKFLEKPINWLAAIPLLGGVKNETLRWEDAAVALGALAVVILCGRPVLRRVFSITRALSWI